jgi:hypothetical protein
MVKLPDDTALGVRLPGAARGQPRYSGGNPVADAFQGFGGDLANFGFNQARQQRQEISKTESLGVQSRFLQFEDQWSKASIDRAQQAQPGAAGYVEGITKDYHQSAYEFLRSVPDELKPEFDKRLFDLQSRLTTSASAFQREESDRYAKQQIDEGQNVLLNRQAKDPSKWQDVERDGERLIRSNPNRSPIEQDADVQVWRKRRAMQLFETRRAQSEEEAREQLGIIRPSGRLPAQVSERSSAAMNYFTGRGYSKEQAAGIVGNLLAESKLNTGARNPGDGTDDTDSIGIGQWNSGRAKALKAFAAQNHADWRDFNVQLAFVDHELRTSESGAGNALKSARTVEEATAAMAGYERPKGWSAENPRGAHNFSGRLSYAQQAAGGKVTGIDEVIDSTILSDPAPEYAALDFEDRLKLYERSLADQRKYEQEQAVLSRMQIETATDNAPAAIMATGSYTGPMPTQEQFVQAYGIEAPQRYEAFQVAIETSETAFQMQAMPVAQVQETVAAARPTSTGEDAAIQTRRYETLSSAAEATLKARAADPAGYVQQAFPSVKQAWEEVDSDEGFERAVAASVAAQQRLGITNIQPIPKPVISNAMAMFKDVTLPEGERFESISRLLGATGDGVQRKAIFEQMVDEGLPETIEGAVLALERGDQAAARRLFQAATVDIGALPGKVDATPSEIEQSIQDNLMDEGLIGDIYYGLSDGIADNLLAAQRDSKLLKNAVTLRMYSGDSLDDAVAGAAKDLFGDVQAVLDSNVQILLPTSTDPEPVVAGLQAALPDVRRALSAIKPRVTNAVQGNALDNYIDMIVANGFFRNAGDGYAFIDSYTGNAVSDRSGAPVIFHPATQTQDGSPIMLPNRPAPIDPNFEKRTPEPGAGPSIDENGNPMVLQ